MIPSFSPTYRRAIKVVSKAVNLDWINNQACRLSQNIYVITNLFITNNYLFEMKRKIIFTDYFYQSFNTSCPLCFLFVFIRLVFCFDVCNCFSSKPKQNQGLGLVDRKLIQAPSNFIAGRPRRLFCFCSLVILGVACFYLWIFLLNR